jgi:hypothetical protein
MSLAKKNINSLRKGAAKRKGTAGVVITKTQHPANATLFPDKVKLVNELLAKAKLLPS